MESKTFWNKRLLMLWACGSPGSALAFHLGGGSFEPDLMQRTTGAAAPGAEGDNASRGGTQR